MLLSEDGIIRGLASPKRTSDVIAVGCSERTNWTRQIDDEPPTVTLYSFFSS